MTTLVSTRAAFHVPDDLTELDQWLLWRYENRTKVPYSTAGRRASSTDPTSWCSYDEALDAWHRNSERWTGIGFVFHESDPFVGIDLDDSLDEHAIPKPWARGIVERFADTYCEISPSEHGLKLWCRGTLSTNVGKVVVGDGGIEMYSRARFFTVTGNAFRGAPLQVEDHASDVLELARGLDARPPGLEIPAGGWRKDPARKAALYAGLHRRDTRSTRRLP